MGKTILITGGAWYIGSHWVVAFEEAGYRTVIVDNLCNSSISSFDWIEKILWYKPDFYELDLRNKVWMEEVFKKYNFDWVLHFAWLKAVWESCEKPLKYFDNNVNGSICLFELMEKYSVKNIIFSSSATVYNSDNSIPFTESQEVWNTSNPYGTTKYLIEQILLNLSKFSWFRVMNLRYFNPIWAHESWEIWEDVVWLPNNLLPYILKVAKWELSKLKVFWDNYNTIDGTGVRDYIDVNDLIEWHLNAYEKLTSPQPSPLKEEQVEFNTYNLWVGKWTSVLEIVNLVEKVTWKQIDLDIVWRRDWDLAEVYCNPNKIEVELWWKVKTSLADSIKNTWKFINK